MPNPLKSKRAVVIGGSIAGLLSAKVLSDSFEEVIIVERDRIEANAAERIGVPQSPQPHILLTKGYRVLKDFFPDLDSDLAAAGAVPVDWGRDFHYFSFGDWCATTTESTGLKSFSCTRPLLENAVRQQVEQIENVTRLSPCRVEGLVGDTTAVTGVRCRGAKDKTDERCVQADLVVDASGRSSNAAKWLVALGGLAPTVETIDAKLGYATQRYRLPSDWAEDWEVLLIGHQPPDNPRLGYLARVENGEMIATLGGYCQDYPPLDQASFLQFAQSLPTPAFYDAIAQSTPVSEIKAYRSTANRLRRYDQIEAMPSGFVAVGDAVCALCPAYGQGLTTSAMSALTLRDWIETLAGSTRMPDSLAFQKKLAKAIQPAWTVATSTDSGFVEDGDAKKGLFSRLLAGYMNKLVAKTHTDSELNLTLTRIAHMVDSPAKLLNPMTILKVVS